MRFLDWEEHEHPRDPDGKFTEGASGVKYDPAPVETALASLKSVSSSGEKSRFTPEIIEAVAAYTAVFKRPDGKELNIGEFPAWIVKSKRRGGPCALMFDFGQFKGGEVVLTQNKRLTRYPI